MSRLLQEAKKHFEQAAQAHTLTFHDIEGTVSGRRARGLELDGEKAKVTLLAVDHDRGIYVVLLVIAKDADQNERDAGAFIFEQIRIIEDQ